MRRISCGGHHFAAVDAGGRLYTWGDTENGRLGHGTVETAPPTPYWDGREVVDEEAPRMVAALAGQRIEQCEDIKLLP